MPAAGKQQKASFVVKHAQPCSASASPKNSPNVNFLLSGSQVNLTPRPSSKHHDKSKISGLPSQSKPRPMSALASHSSTSKIFSGKPRPKSADVTKPRGWRKTASEEISSQSLRKTFDEMAESLSLEALINSGTNELSSPLSDWTDSEVLQHSYPEISLSSSEQKEFSTPETLELAQKHSVSSASLEVPADQHFDQCVETTIMQTRKQLRFAEEETHLFSLSIPSEVMCANLKEPVESFLDDLVHDIQDIVRDTTDGQNEESFLTVDFTLPEEKDLASKLSIPKKIFSETKNEKDVFCASEIQKKPRTISELLEIVDSEIPFHFAKKPRVLPKPILVHRTNPAKLINVPKSINEAEALTPGNAAEYQDSLLSRENISLENTFDESKEAGAESAGKLENENGLLVSEDRNIAAKSAFSDLSDIFVFLDAVEKSEELNVDERQYKIVASNRHSTPETQRSNKKIDHQVNELHEILEERDAHVRLLKETLLQCRVEASDALTAAAKEHKTTLRKQKIDHEASMKKLQDNIDKLVADKKQLLEKVEQVLQQLRNLEGKHQAHIQSLQQTHVVEIARTKQMAAAAEKIRRERWVERQTARIKELTVKGLEPELTRLSLQHDNKVAQLQTAHAKELQARAELESRKLEELRVQMLRDKDEELVRERAVLSERFEIQLSQERALLEQRCERLKEEAAVEAARLQAAAIAARESAEAQARLDARRAKELHDNEIAQLEEKKQAELAGAQEALREEQRLWLAAQARKHADALAEANQQLRAERDAEIERAIEKLEDEERRSRAEMEKDFEKKLARQREQHVSVLADRDLSERLLQARLADAQNAMQISEEQMLAARAAESRLRQELCIAQQRVEALEAEQNRVREIVAIQFEEKVSDLESRLEQSRVDRRAELDQLHNRLKAVLEKKEKHVEQLKDRETELSKRCRHLESLLGQQPLASSSKRNV